MELKQALPWANLLRNIPKLVVQRALTRHEKELKNKTKKKEQSQMERMMVTTTTTTRSKIANIILLMKISLGYQEGGERLQTPCVLLQRCDEDVIRKRFTLDEDPVMKGNKRSQLFFHLHFRLQRALDLVHEMLNPGQPPRYCVNGQACLLAMAKYRRSDKVKRDEKRRDWTR
eukprot:745999-Hanusia_phi.AAC.9